MIPRSLLFLMLSLLAWNPLPAILRAAIDFGSGGPKLRIAEVDPAHNKIIKILHVSLYPVFLQTCLSHYNMLLTREIMTEGVNALKEAIHSAHSFGAQEIVIIGGSSFRNAVNAEVFI